MTGRVFEPVLPWLPAAGFTIYTKAVLMLQTGVCYDCFSLGRQSLPDKLSELSFFRADLVLGFLLVPAILIALASYRRRAGVVTSAFCATAVLILMALQRQCLQNVGVFVTADLLVDAAVWGVFDQTGGSEYVPWADLALLAAGVAAVWIATRLRIPRIPSGVAAVLGLVYVAALAGAWLIPVPETAAHSAVLRLAVSPASQWEPDDIAHWNDLPAEELIERYRQMVNGPHTRHDERYWASHAGSDVIVFIYETAPAQCLPINGDLTDLPALARLRERAVIATNHLSTAPVTRLATLSLLNSLYPPTAGFKVLQQMPVRRWPGLPGALADAGYDTAVYSPGDPGRTSLNYGEQLKAQGMNRIVFTPRPMFRQGPNRLEGKERHLAEDREAARLLRVNIGKHAEKNQRYLAVFTPIIGHAPWWDPTQGKIPNAWDRGRAILRLQDEMLGGIVADLERLGRLDDTVLVVTSDHGIRTRKELPSFPVGWVDPISYHVPLLIWAPRAVEKTITIDEYTSHIDVAPTVADLLGLDTGREFEQGAPVWDMRISDRATMYLGRFTFGADALRRDGKFTMYSHMPDTTYTSSSLEFGEADVRRDSGAVELLHSFSGLQRALLDRLQSD